MEEGPSAVSVIRQAMGWGASESKQLPPAMSPRGPERETGLSPEGKSTGQCGQCRAGMGCIISSGGGGRN